MTEYMFVYTAASPLTLGADKSQSNEAVMLMDEFLGWDVALSAEEVKLLYQSYNQ